ncbi:hypothetical protein JYK14_13295 [Siccirubricoccus sp. KC 17139]|uniref:Uncharacterized protein n=1 Tax=Siccirubricoccus soli TaxID=2899147 RepID=A0ABT1D7A4_9PROT|nr:hypothetical protein [Siccirubricoccus soli]MCO6417130.1 hypothetical protein [Siccirubricoccus soli]MCP2683265.1 hypothetical protein [Siccirubricoccus soli]
MNAKMIDELLVKAAELRRLRTLMSCGADADALLRDALSLERTAELLHRSAARQGAAWYLRMLPGQPMPGTAS